MFYFYIFRCKDTTLYCGSTNNLLQRENRHNSGRGARYTKIHGGGKIIYSESFDTLKEAMWREAEVKKWPRKKKKSLIKRDGRIADIVKTELEKEIGRSVVNKNNFLKKSQNKKRLKK